LGVRLIKSAIYRFNCDLDGFTPVDHKTHFFLILSHEKYNSKMNSYLGVGLSSKSHAHIKKFLIEDIPEYVKPLKEKKYQAFQGSNELTVIVDKVTRLREKDLIFHGQQVEKPLLILPPERYKELVEEIKKFMMIPNNEDNV
jgi:hypothetical protein